MNRGVSAIVVALALLAGVLCDSPVFAQANQQAQLRITVIDQTGASIPGARVRVTAAGGAASEAIVNEQGQATVASLPAGPVDLSVASDGFSPYTNRLILRRGNNNQTVTLYVAGQRTPASVF